jgi:LPS-assembly protein
MPRFAFFALAGLFYFCAPALAEQASTPEPFFFVPAETQNGRKAQKSVQPDISSEVQARSIKFEEFVETGSEYRAGQSFIDGVPQWARNVMQNLLPPTQTLQEVTSQEFHTANASRADAQLVSEREISQNAPFKEVGYSVANAPELPLGHNTDQSEGTGISGVASPVVRAHVRGPEEEGRTIPRDERIPADLGPFAWVPAMDAPPPVEPGVEDLPWELSAERVTAYNQNSVVEAEGEVLLRRGYEYIKTDFARYFAETGWVYLKGNVEIYFGADRLSGEEAEFDLANKVGWLKNGHVFMAGPHVYLSGERVNKNWGDTYTFRNAKITMCDGDIPAWSLYADDAVVELDGYARLWGSSLAIRNRKIAHSPYMILPAKRDRQSGFLMPRFGHDRRKGFYWNQSYFWAIDQSQDLTLNTYVMSNRGTMLGAEYRTKRDWDENLWLRTDYLYDSVTWNKLSDNYFDNEFLRTNANRFWLRGMYDGTLTSDRKWKAKLNLDYVSDGFFLREFRNDPAGYNTTRNYLEESFGRALAPWSSNRVSEGIVYRDWSRFTVSAGMRYEQNPYLGQGNQPRSSDVMAQKLPEINLYMHRGKVWEDSPLEVEGQGQMVYFYRLEGVRGTRYDINPKLSLPFRNDYGSLIPRVSLRGTRYQVGSERKIQGDTGDSDDRDRAVPEFSLAGFTEFARNYTLDSAPLALSENAVGDRRWSSLRHVIQPRVDYTKRWKINQDDLPYFDVLDRLGPRDEVVYSITNLFTVRRENVELDKDKNPVIRDDYLDLVRFKLEAGYDFDESRRTWRADAYKRRPFMDILAELTVTPGERFSTTNRTWWSPYNGEFTRMSNSISVWEQGVGRASVGIDSRRRPDEYKRWSSDILYRDLSLLHRGLIGEDQLLSNRYREPVDLLYTNVQLDYLAPLTFRFNQWYDLRVNKAQETSFSVVYTHQCFQLEANAWWDQYSESYGFFIRLPGFWN